MSADHEYHEISRGKAAYLGVKRWHVWMALIALVTVFVMPYTVAEAVDSVRTSLGVFFSALGVDTR